MNQRPLFGAVGLAAETIIPRMRPLVTSLIAVESNRRQSSKIQDCAAREIADIINKSPNDRNTSPFGVTYRNSELCGSPTADTHPEPGFPILPVTSGINPKPTFPLFNPAGAQSPVGADQSVFAPS